MSGTAEELVKIFEDQMRKGFLGIIVLHIIRDQPSHGYKITQEIANRTKGFWRPQLSVVYASIRKLAAKELIELNRTIEDGNRRSKEYKLSEKGEEVLNMCADKLKGVIKMMRSILLSFFGLDSFETDVLEWDEG